MIRPLLLISALMAAALGCGRPSPVVTFHTLSPLSQPAAAQRPLALEIMPVQLPELLQRSQIVVLSSQGTHRLAPSHRWGNTLEKDLQRVLAENLSALLGSPSVVLYPEGTRTQATHRISLEVSQCDGTPGRTLLFRAIWMITRLDTGRVAVLKRTSLEEAVAGATIEDLVSAHDRLLERLSAEIAEALKAVP